MVWAIHFASEFNEFFPRGEFRGYREALAAHYGFEARPGPTPRHQVQYAFTGERPLDGEGEPYLATQDYFSDVGEKFHAELGVRRPHKPPLLPIEPHEWPEEYVIERAHKRPAAILQLTNRMYAVDEGLCAIIGRLEPNVHAFHAIRMVLRKGEALSVSYHMMIVGRWLDAFRLEDSDPKCLRVSASGTTTVFSDKKEHYAGVAMSAAEIGDAHLWCERRFRSARFFISDQLKDEVDAAGLRLPPSFRMKAV